MALEREPKVPNDVRPEGWTETHEVIAQALYADLWTEPKSNDPSPDWPHRFSWWQCIRAANMIVPALVGAGRLEL